MSECPPQVCPVCNYSLAGLPLPHRCPECGFAYDEATRIWRAPRRRATWLDFVWPMACVGLILYFIVPMFRWKAGNLFDLALLGAVLLFLSWLIPTFVRQARNREMGHLVALSPNGVFVRNPAGEEWIDWCSVGWVKFSGEFQYIQHAGSTRSTQLPDAFAKADAREAFAREVDDCRARYLSFADSMRVD